MSCRFSVVMPCHNPDLAQMTLAVTSILNQSGASRELIIVNDAGTNGVVPKVADSVPCRYIRLDEEVGGCRATNIGIRAATGDLVQVCHPDDWVLQGFYQMMDQADQIFDTALHVCGHLDADEGGTVWGANLARYPQFGRFPPLHEGNSFAVNACVIRRSFYEEHGVWNESLIHTADWEMWHRAAVKGRMSSYSLPLAVYRHHAANHTSRLMVEADNLRDYLTMAEVIAEYAPVEKLKFRAYVAFRARNQERSFRESGNFAAANANGRLAAELEASLPKEMIQ